jgi:dTDP-4-amino-4,6-dideoxygalactose transaminase
MHFDRAHVHMGISPVTLRIARSQDLAEIVERRRRNYLFLLDRLRDVSPPLFDELPPGVCPLFYPIVADDKPELLQRLWARGVEATDFWRDHHPACDPAEFPDVMWLRSSIVEVPCHQDLDLRRMTRMAKVVREAVRGVTATTSGG